MPMIDLVTGEQLEVKASDLTPTEVLVQIGHVANEHTPASVPCGTCTSCCWYQRIDVNPAKETAEDLSYMELVEDEKGFQLARHDHGPCVHLGDRGCTIWAHRPEVCRCYDCRPFGLAGLMPQSVSGHRTPAWKFELKTPLDRAIVIAARMAALPFVEACLNGTPGPSLTDSSTMAAVLKGIYENLPKTRAMVAAYDRLPPEDRARVDEELASERQQFQERVNARWREGAS